MLKEDAAATADELREFLAPRFAKWCLPDRIEFVAEIPKTSVGKFLKTALREQFAGEPATTGLERPSSARSTGRSSCARFPILSRRTARHSCAYAPPGSTSSTS